MRIFKVIKCAKKGHILDTPSIINFGDRNTYIKKCSRCGLYEVHVHLIQSSTVTLTETEAFQWKQEFEEMFQQAKEGESNAESTTRIP